MLIYKRASCCEAVLPPNSYTEYYITVLIALINMRMSLILGSAPNKNHPKSSLHPFIIPKKWNNPHGSYESQAVNTSVQVISSF